MDITNPNEPAPSNISQALPRQSEIRDSSREVFTNKLEQIKKLPIISEGLASLPTELNGIKLDYHIPAHTDSEVEGEWGVLQEIIFLGVQAGLGDEDLEDLAIAATYHDWGFHVVYRMDDQKVANEDYGAGQAGKMMREHEYSEERINKVKRMIDSTKIIRTDDGRIIQKPTEDPSSHFLQDADVANFGRGDFFAKMLVVFKEEVAFGFREDNPEGRSKFVNDVLKLLENHSFKTDAAGQVFNEVKSQNLNSLRGIDTKASNNPTFNLEEGLQPYLRKAS